MQPLTPPRIKSQPRSSVPYTPKTPFGKKLNKPSSSVLSPIQTISNALLTPGPTPRHSSRKRKETLGEAINLNPLGVSSPARTLFPPTPSTIGSGRSKVYALSPIRRREDDDGTTNIIKTKRKLTFESDENQEEEKDEDFMKEFGVKKTPGGQLITDKLINEWNDEVPKDGFSDDEEEFITKKPLVNPFITRSKGPIIRRNLPNQTEITLINKKGEKIIRKLTEEESTYEPKNLFGSLTKEEFNHKPNFLFGTLNNEQAKIDVYNDNDDLNN